MLMGVPLTEIEAAMAWDQLVLEYEQDLLVENPLVPNFLRR